MSLKLTAVTPRLRPGDISEEKERITDHSVCKRIFTIQEASLDLVQKYRLLIGYRVQLCVPDACASGSGDKEEEEDSGPHSLPGPGR